MTHKITNWCMSFSFENAKNNDIKKTFDFCCDNGIAAMETYYKDGPKKGESIFGNLDNTSQNEFNNHYDALNKKDIKPKQILSMEDLRYRVKKDDIIYARKGCNEILGKGTVTKPYYNDESVFNECDIKGIHWPHMFGVTWEEYSRDVKLSSGIRGRILFELDVDSKTMSYSDAAKQILKK